MIASRDVKTALAAPPPRVSASDSDAEPRHVRALFERAAEAQGFRRFGVAPARPPAHGNVFERWLQNGFHATMDYLPASRGLRADPATLLPGARSVLVLSHAYSAADPSAPDGARTARYALAEDYHRTLRRKCDLVVASVRAAGVEFEARICVDSAPLNERDFAASAGIGWVGKNGMILNREDGSYFLLCEILLDIALPFDALRTDHCGSCTRCLDACPTDAFVAPRVLDASRCLSYWTIEQREVIPEEIVERMNGWVFGCDICQEACPYNRPIEAGSFDREAPTLRALLETGSAEWKRRWADTPLARAGAAGMRRNAAAAASGAGAADLLPALAARVAGDHAVVAEQARRASEKLSPR